MRLDVGHGARHATAPLAPDRVAIRQRPPLTRTEAPNPSASIAGMNYELFMGEALAEAQLALARGERPTRPSPSSTRRWSSAPTTASRRRTTRPPTPWSSPCARRPASSARVRLADATIFTTQEPCAMCVGALLESDVEALVFAVAERPGRRRRDGHPARPAPRPAPPDQGRQRDPPRRGRGPVRAARRRAEPASEGGRPGRVWYPLPRRGVRVVDGAALEKRCAKAPRVRIPPSPPSSHRLTAPGARCRLRSSLTHLECARSGARLRLARNRHIDANVVAIESTGRPCRSWRGRLVDYGAALEMRFGATRRGFESRPLRHSVCVGCARCAAVLATHSRARAPACSPSPDAADAGLPCAQPA